MKKICLSLFLAFLCFGNANAQARLVLSGSAYIVLNGADATSLSAC